MPKGSQTHRVIRRGRTDIRQLSGTSGCESAGYAGKSSTDSE